MRNQDYFKGKRIVIVGFARSGLACANLLFDLGARVSITDNKSDDLVFNNKKKLRSANIKVELGGHSQDFIKGNDLLVISPGVPNEAMPISWAKEQGIPVISEIELAWVLCPANIIAVTGSNGKTTVTTLIGKILEAAGKKVFVCGNIGRPFSGEVERMKADDYVSLEVSSFQLENIRDFKPKVSVLLNFTRNHMDRYTAIEQYLDAKKRIFINQDASDYAVFNSDDPVLRQAANDSRAKVVLFGKVNGLNPNHSAVMAVGSILGINEDLCRKVFNDFGGVEHRMEFVAEINQVKFINDSKATTVESAMWALRSINSPIILIAGGKDKGLHYEQVLPAARGKVREVILIGEAREKIKNSLQNDLSVHEANTLKDAVSLAFCKANPGDSVLLSPMCASFDMFSDYEQRGRVFKEIVLDLVKNGAKY
ncbi:MAG: UDP-N-acetylmuramoyl-L-alanine--D-glutamate ligase [Candidatus Omnitrophica bacterium]|nr:UDP-N-acetylmuramoyl-L-alanine--D-glutamate ligase [Candidatus Omnitrophota bacterium]